MLTVIQFLSLFNVTAKFLNGVPLTPFPPQTFWAFLHILYSALVFRNLYAHHIIAQLSGLHSPQLSSGQSQSCSHCRPTPSRNSACTSVNVCYPCSSFPSNHFPVSCTSILRSSSVTFKSHFFLQFLPWRWRPFISAATPGQKFPVSKAGTKHHRVPGCCCRLFSRLPIVTTSCRGAPPPGAVNVFQTLCKL